MKRPTLKKIGTLAACFAVIWSYSLIRKTGPIVAPTHWAEDSSRAVRAMNENRLDEAETALASAMKRARDHNSSHEIGTTEQNLGELRMQQGRLDEAAQYYADAAVTLKGDPSVTPYRWVGLHRGAAIIAVKRGDFAAAERSIRLAIAAFELMPPLPNGRPADEKDLLSTLNDLAAVLVARGRVAEANEVRARADAIRDPSGPASQGN